MKCQRCQKRDATILIRQSVNGHDSETLLCQDCMIEMGSAGNFGFNFSNNPGAGFAAPQQFPSHNAPNLTGAYNSGVFVSGKKDDKVCCHCNTTQDEIRKKGKLGCSHCYETFEEQLGQIFRRIQSSDKHRGRRIAESKEKNEINGIQAVIEELQLKIRAAVGIEDYENAAKYKEEIESNRDKIERIEKMRLNLVDPKTEERAACDVAKADSKTSSRTINSKEQAKPRKKVNSAGKKKTPPDQKEGEDHA